MATRRSSGPGNPRDELTRVRIAQEAGRLMAEEGIHDFAVAKRKAVERLGLPAGRNLPGNQEIEAALIAHQRLFRAHTQPKHLKHLRETALRAMRLLDPFQPRLIGPVLSGTADSHSPVQLHLFADAPEQVDLFLMEHNIPYEHDERMLRVSAERQERYPACRFMAGDTAVELTIFSAKGMRQAPLSPVDGRPMRRAGIETVEALIREADAPDYAG